MKISKELSKKILVIGVSLKDKGGIATIVKTMSEYYEVFNYLPSARTKNPFISSIYFLRSIILLPYYSLIKKIKIVHIHGSFNGSFYRKMILINISKLLNIKIIYHMHSGGFDKFYEQHFNKKLILDTLNKVDIIISPSTYNSLFFKRILTPDSKNIIINNFIETPNYKKEYVPITGKIKLLYLGAIIEHKGIFDLIDVIIANRDYLAPNIYLTIGGVGNHKFLVDLIKENNLGEIVDYRGWINKEEKETLFLSNDIFIMPSHFESFGMANLEAMSYGLPIISSNVGGIPDVVVNNKNGILITPGNKDDLFKAIKEYIENKDKIEAMGKMSIEIANHFTPEFVLPQLSAIYQKLECY